MEGEWEEKYSEKHQRKYWKNKVTGASSWKDPSKSNEETTPAATKPATQQQEVAEKKSDNGGNEQKENSTEEWEELFSEKHKRKYWKSKVTGQSSWKDPRKAATETKEEKASSKQEEEPQKQNPVSQPKTNDEWEECFSEKHKRKYWKNKTTGKSSWTLPTATDANDDAKSVVSMSSVKTKDTEKDNETVVSKLSVDTTATAGGDQWIELFSDKHNRKYWKNKVTGKSTWTKPTASEVNKTNPNTPTAGASTTAATAASATTVTADTTIPTPVTPAVVSAPTVLIPPTIAVPPQPLAPPIIIAKPIHRLTFSLVQLQSSQHLIPTFAILEITGNEDKGWKFVFYSLSTTKTSDGEEYDLVAPSMEAFPTISTSTDQVTKLVGERDPIPAKESKILHEIEVDWLRSIAIIPSDEEQSAGVCGVKIDYVPVTHTSTTTTTTTIAPIVDAGTASIEHVVLQFPTLAARKEWLSMLSPVLKMACVPSNKLLVFTTTSTMPLPTIVVTDNTTIYFPDLQEIADVSKGNLISLAAPLMTIPSVLLHNEVRLLTWSLQALETSPWFDASKHQGSVKELKSRLQQLSTTAAVSDESSSTCRIGSSNKHASSSSSSGAEQAYHKSSLEMLRDLPTEGIVLVQLSSTTTPITFQTSSAHSLNSFIPHHSPNQSFYPCYFRIDHTKLQLHLHEYGPNQPPSCSLQCHLSSSTVDTQALDPATSMWVGNLAHPLKSEWLYLSLVNCTLIPAHKPKNRLNKSIEYGLPSAQDAASFYHIHLRFESYSSLLSYTLSLTQLSEGLFSFIRNTVTHTCFSRKKDTHLTPSNANQQILSHEDLMNNQEIIRWQAYYALESNLMEQDLLLDGLRYLQQQYVGIDCKSMRLEVIPVCPHKRSFVTTMIEADDEEEEEGGGEVADGMVVVVDHGLCDKIPNYSVLLSLNGLLLSQLHQKYPLLQWVEDLPEEMKIDLVYVRFPRYDCVVQGMLLTHDDAQLDTRAQHVPPYAHGEKLVVEWEDVYQTFVTSRSTSKLPSWQSFRLQLVDGQCILRSPSITLTLDIHSFQFQLVSGGEEGFLVHIYDAHQVHVVVRVQAFTLFQVLIRKLLLLQTLFSQSTDHVDHGYARPIDWLQVLHEVEEIQQMLHPKKLHHFELPHELQHEQWAQGEEESKQISTGAFFTSSSATATSTAPRVYSGLLQQAHRATSSLRSYPNALFPPLPTDDIDLSYPPNQFIALEESQAANLTLQGSHHTVDPMTSSLINTVESLEETIRIFESPACTIPTIQKIDQVVTEIRQLNKTNHQIIQDLLVLQVTTNDNTNTNSNHNNNALNVFQESPALKSAMSKADLLTPAEEVVPPSLAAPSSTNNGGEQSAITGADASHNHNETTVTLPTQEEPTTTTNSNSTSSTTASAEEDVMGMPAAFRPNHTAALPPPPPTTSSSGNPTMTKLQRRASRLSISIDLNAATAAAAAAAAAASSTTTAASANASTNSFSTTATATPSNAITTNTTTNTTTITSPVSALALPTPTASAAATMNSIFSAKPFATKLFLLAPEEQQALNYVFAYLRESPSMLLQMASKIVTAQDLLIFGYLVIHRLYGQYSSNNHMILQLLQIAHLAEIDSKLHHSLLHHADGNTGTSSITTSLSAETNPLDDVYQSTFAEFFSYFVLSSGASMTPSSTPAGSASFRRSLNNITTAPSATTSGSVMGSIWHPWVCVLLYESCQRVEITHYLDRLCQPLPLAAFLQQQLTAIGTLLLSNTLAGNTGSSSSMVSGSPTGVVIGADVLPYVDQMVAMASICHAIVDPFMQVWEQVPMPVFLWQVLVTAANTTGAATRPPVGPTGSSSGMAEASFAVSSTGFFPHNKEVDASATTMSSSASSANATRTLLAATILPFLLRYCRSQLYACLQADRLQALTTGSAHQHQLGGSPDDGYTWLLKSLDEDVLPRLIQAITDKIRHVLSLAFGLSTASDHWKLSLADSALLSKSKWTFNRRLDMLLEDSKTFQDTVNPMPTTNTKSPVAWIAQLHPTTHRVRAMDSLMAFRPSEMLYLLELLDSTHSSTAVATAKVFITKASESDGVGAELRPLWLRATMDAFLLLQRKDLLGRLAQYALYPYSFHPSNSSNNGSTNKKTYCANQLDRDMTFVVDVDGYQGNGATKGSTTTTPTTTAGNSALLPASTAHRRDVLATLKDVSWAGELGVDVTGHSTHHEMDATSSAEGQGQHMMRFHQENALQVHRLYEQQHQEVQSIRWLLQVAKALVNRVYQHDLPATSGSSSAVVPLLHKATGLIRELQTVQGKLQSKLIMVYQLQEDWQYLMQCKDSLLSTKTQLQLVYAFSKQHHHPASVSTRRTGITGMNGLGEYWKGPPLPASISTSTTPTGALSDTNTALTASMFTRHPLLAKAIRAFATMPMITTSGGSGNNGNSSGIYGYTTTGGGIPWLSVHEEETETALAELVTWQTKLTVNNNSIQGIRARPSPLQSSGNGSGGNKEDTSDMKKEEYVPSSSDADGTYLRPTTGRMNPLRVIMRNVFSQPS